MKLKLIKVKDEASGTKSFFWESDQKVDFIAGQYFYYTLPKLDYEDDRGPTRHFTISSSPTEKLLRLTTRIRKESGYKKTLSKLSIGSVIEGQGPEGLYVNFSEDDKGPHVFIAGGIGITPFRSIIKYSLDKKLKIPFYLIYSNSDQEFVFKDELDAWTAQYPLKIKYLNTSKSGHLDKEGILKALAEWKLDKSDLTFWLIGPPPFINAMEDEADKLKIASDKIKTEKFSGY